MQPPPTQTSPIDPDRQQEARFLRWREGNLRYKLKRDLTQLRLYDAIKACPSNEYVTEGSRKLGKSYMHGIICLETALQNPGKQINWATNTGKLCRQTLLPILEEISADAPPECMGRYDGLNGQWVLPNGAVIRLVGAETKQDCQNSRGPSCIAVVVDEAGFVDLLEYLIDAVLSKQMMRVKRIPGTFIGMTLLVSTTPYTPSHHFCRRADVAAIQGNYRKLTVYDSGWQTREEVEASIAADAIKKGLTVDEYKATSTFRRELMSERVIDEEAVVFPEFHRVREQVVCRHPRPIGFEQYIRKRVSVDLGMADKTGLLFGYVDFTAARVVVEAERLLEKPNTRRIADEVRAVEGDIWDGANPSRTSRVVDDPHGRVVLDLWDLERLRFDKAIKHDRDASIGMVRTMLAQHKLLISPDCIQLQRQLLEATRQPNKKDFERNDEGHYDLCAALMYFVRGLDIASNPYPHNYDVVLGREMPATHPLMARREAMNADKPRGLSGAIFGHNQYVSRGLKRRSR